MIKINFRQSGANSLEDVLLKMASKALKEKIEFAMIPLRSEVARHGGSITVDFDAATKKFSIKGTKVPKDTEEKIKKAIQRALS